MRYETNLRQLHDLRVRLQDRYLERDASTGTSRFRGGVEPYACVVTGHSDDGCDGPHYHMWHVWASAVIHDRIYKPDSEPIAHWRFNVIQRPGAYMIVTPIFEPFDLHLVETRKSCAQIGWAFSEHDEIDYQRTFHGQSNWRANDDYLLRVVLPDQNRTIRGYIEGSDFCYTYLPDKALAQDVLDSLWAATRNDERAYQGATQCAFCSKPLKDPLASSRGYGPDCAKRYGMPMLRVIEGGRL
jgi:hypothetical protein